LIGIFYNQPGFGFAVADINPGGHPPPLRSWKMKTGQDVKESGLYVSECCGEEVMLVEDASFPRCRRCNGLSEWELVDLPGEKAA